MLRGCGDYGFEGKLHFQFPDALFKFITLLFDGFQFGQVRRLIQLAIGSCTGIDWLDRPVIGLIAFGGYYRCRSRSIVESVLPGFC